MMEKITIVLNKNIYDKKMIEQALKDYSEACEGKIVDDKVTVELIPKEKFDEPVKEEFCNYVLGLMKNNTVV